MYGLNSIWSDAFYPSVTPCTTMTGHAYFLMTSLKRRTGSIAFAVRGKAIEIRVKASCTGERMTSKTNRYTRAGLSQSAALFQLLSPSLPFPSLHSPLHPFFSHPSPSLFIPFPFPSRNGPLKTSGSWERCNQGPRGRARAADAFCCMVCSQNASGCSINVCVCAIIKTSKSFKLAS